MSFSLLAQFALWGSFALSVQAASGSGTSTRYWDCCKPSCAWPQKANVNQPVYTCDASDRFLSDFNTKSGCDTGTAYTCTNQAPWALNSLVSYGFAATAISGETEADWCCGCYAVTFTSGKAKGKVMLLQSTNTGSDLANNHFDLQIPGGGLGIFDGCTSQFGGIPGSRYGGISSRSDCAAMPAALQAGCYWRFDWFNNADNPTHTFTQIQCPAELVNRTGCRRADDASFPVYTMPSATTWNPPVPTETAAAYSQCDSLTWDVAKMCPVGYTCSYVTDYYWQCVQGSSPSSTKTSSAVTSSKPGTDIISSSSRPATTSSSTKTTTSTTASSPTATGSVPAWGQCNAVTWPTPAKCQDGLKCVYINDFYSQCQP